MFVADYRMPQMSGIEFLEAAMDIFPMARRVLLTAYADTHAAIDAINVVDLDHYLLKPWDPPEEKLYPVIDALIEAWRATGDRAIPPHQDRRPSVECAILRCPRVPGPKPVVLHMVSLRRAERRSASGSGGRGRADAAGRDHRAG